MLAAVNMGWVQSPSLVLSSRCSICRLRTANCLRILGFTRNPFRDGLKDCHYPFRRREKPRDFEFFQNLVSSNPSRFAFLRASVGAALEVGGSRIRGSYGIVGHGR